MNKRLRIVFSTLFLLININAFSNNCVNELSNLPDTLIADTNKLWFNKTDFLLVGLNGMNRNFEMTFKNNSANLIGVLDWNHDWDNRNVANWKYFPVYNQASVGVNFISKYGSFSFSKAINVVSSKDFTKTNALNIFIPLKRFNVGIDYLKYTGINRTDPTYNKTVFLKDMSYQIVAINASYSLGRLKNNLLYVPKKRSFSTSILFGGSQLVLKDKTDFLPALMYKNDDPNDSIIQLNNLFMDKFSSTGAYFGFKIEMVLPLLKSKSKFKPNVLYIKGCLSVAYYNQKFEYHTISNQFTNVQYKLFMQGFGITENYYALGHLIYDFSRGMIGFGAVYNQQSYGKSNSGSLAETNNHMSDTRITYTVYLNFRIGAKGIYGKMDSFKKKILHK